MIRKVKFELGAIASRMWKEARVAGDQDGNTLLANMCESFLPAILFA